MRRYRRTRSCANAGVAHTRGVVVSVSGSALQLKADSGQTLAVKLADRYTVSARSHADVTKIAPGAFLGTTAIPGPDGTLTAVEVHIFPESMRGTGEGHRPMDAAPGSTTTDATVAAVTVGPRHACSCRPHHDQRHRRRIRGRRYRNGG